LVLRKPEDRSAEDLHLLDLVEQAHPQVKVACALAQAFVQMIRNRNASALQPWLEEAARSGVSELRTFATSIKRDQAALTYEWSQGQVEGQINRLKLLKRQSYGRASFDLLRHRVLARRA
jgi:transposase